MSGARPDSSDPAIRNLYWEPWGAPGREHVRVSLDIRRAAQSNAVVADGLVLLYRNGRALRCHYRLTADACLRPLGLSGRLYRYQSRSSCFSADLAVDSGGFVVDYPDSFRRIW